MMEAGARARLYGFFSRLFVRELDESAVGLLQTPHARELLPEFDRSGERDVRANPEMRVAVFDGDFVHLTVVNLIPYASFYLREDAMVEGGTANVVARFLERHGFEVDLGAARALAPDHLGIQLEFMSVLCGREAEAVGRAAPVCVRTIRDVQRTFLETFVLSWAPVYLFAVERCGRTRLYREVAQVLVDFMGSDHEGLVLEAEA